MSYLGSYSNYNIGTHRDTKLKLEPDDEGKLNLALEADGTLAKPDRHMFTEGSLADANLNVAKIRVISTIPKKTVADEIKDKAYVGFILTDVQESHSEKVELIPLPGDNFASYFYGSNPRQFNFSGILLNTEQDQWRDSFEQMYEEHLRGSKSSRVYNIVQVRYGKRVVSGWLTNMTQQVTSQSDLYSQFTFSMLISRIDMLGGSHTYEKYLTKEAGEFTDLPGDYAILDADNFNELVDPTNTGAVVPPKRKHSGGGKRSITNCYFREVKTDSKKPLNSGDVTISDHVNDASSCTVIGAFQDINKRTNDIRKKLEKIKNNKNSKANAKTVQRLRTELNRLQGIASKKLKDDKVKEALNQQSRSVIESRLAKLTPEQRFLELSETRKSYKIANGQATITVTYDEDGNVESTTTKLSSTLVDTRYNVKAGAEGITANSEARQAFVAGGEAANAVDARQKAKNQKRRAAEAAKAQKKADEQAGALDLTKGEDVTT